MYENLTYEIDEDMLSIKSIDREKDDQMRIISISQDTLIFEIDETKRYQENLQYEEEYNNPDFYVSKLVFRQVFTKVDGY